MIMGNCPLPLPTTIDVLCGNLIAPANGAVTEQGRNVGDMANYSCDAGYTLDGSAWRTCQSNGSWTGTEPTCNREQVTSL